MKHETKEIDPTIFSIQGNLIELKIAATRVNLAEKIEKNFHEKNIAGSATLALAEMYGMVSTSMMLELYEGEDIYNFVGILNEEIVYGSFSKANKIKNGDEVKLIVEKRGEALYVHSLLRICDNLLLMPLNTYCGKRSFLKGCMKFAWRLTSIIWIIFLLTSFYNIDFKKKDIQDLIIIYSIFIIMPPLLIFPVEYSTYRSMRGSAEYASSIFTAYGFPLPDQLDIRSGMMLYPDESYGYGAINCELALNNHKKKFRIKD